MRKCEVQHLGRMRYGEAFEVQRELVDKRKRGEIPDQLLFVEHPHVITMGRNGQMRHLLASDEVLRKSGIEFYETDRGGDITYHGPGQIVGYPVMDLREWKRDVGAYLRALEQVLIDSIGEWRIDGERVPGATGVWTSRGKVAAIGVHLSRWVTSHGFALNVTTDLSYFRYIVPCGLTKPVTSLEALGCRASKEQLQDALARHFALQFDCEIETKQLLAAL